MLIDTTKAPRRMLQFRCLGCLAAELDRIQNAHDNGTLATTGNWSAGEILDHCANLFDLALDGAPRKAPFIARLFGRLVKGKVLKPGTMPPGFKLPAGATELLPRPGISFAEGMAHMRRALNRINAGERMAKPSAWLGPLTHDQWVRLQLNHTQLHLGFITY